MNMKTVLCAFCMVWFCISANAAVSKKEFNKSFHKKEVKELVISNRYGKIEVEQGTGDSVQVIAVIAVTDKTKAKSDELLEYVNINDTRTGEYLNIVTEFGKDMALKKLVSGVALDIDYKVIAPAGIKMRLINTDGDIFLGDFTGELNVDIKSGNFKADVIKGEEFYIKQDKGEFSVLEVENMTGEFKNVLLNLEDGGEVKIICSDCNGALKSVETLNINATGSDLRLGSIESMTGTSSSAKFLIQDVGNSLDMDMRWGEINIRNIHFNFTTVKVKGSFTKVGLTFMQDAGYTLELKHNKSLKMDLPKDFKLATQPTSQKNQIVETGFIGNKKYNGKVFLDMLNGNLYIL